MFKELSHINKKREEGFTLIELLVVIVIIGILSAVAIGAFLNQRQKAHDATVKADLRSAAHAITTWSVDHDQKDYFENTESGGLIYIVEGKDAVHELKGVTSWNDVEGFPTIHMSDGNMLEIVVSNTDSHVTWSKKFEEGEFCLAGSSPNSTWNYTPGSGRILGYKNYLFYDVEAGGVKTMDELIEAQDNGVNISCLGSVNRYRKAAGV